MEKIGIDLHGVITHEPEKYKAFMLNMMEIGWEVYVLTGSTYKDAKAELGNLWFIQGKHYTNIVSVTDYLLSQKLPWEYDKHRRPWFDNEFWDRAKSDLAEELGLKVHYDDILRYKKYFKNTEFVYCPRIEGDV